MPNRRPYLDSVTFHWEGAYRARDPVEPAAYGYNLVNFMRDVPSIWPQLDKRGMHPDVVKLMDQVMAADKGSRAAGEKLFAGVGSRTEEWLAGRHTDKPIDQKPDTLSYLESVKRIIRPLTEEKYKRTFGFGNIHDDYIRHEAMDSSYIRPHSGVWSLVYAATKSGILSDAQATEWKLKYLSPHDANIPALVSGLGSLPPEREHERGKGAEYMKASKIHALGELINDAPVEKRQQMQKFMHEARTKFFGMTVAVEGERARWGDAEAKTLYAAHTNSNPTEGWLKRAEESFHYYYPPDMHRAVKQAVASVPPKDVAPSPEPSVLGTVACVMTGYYCPKPPRAR
ncbi:MAG: hypothetical protein ACKVOE_00165 [Rickettsiales bacterium]